MLSWLNLLHDLTLLRPNKRCHMSLTEGARKTRTEDLGDLFSLTEFEKVDLWATSEDSILMSQFSAGWPIQIQFNPNQTLTFITFKNQAFLLKLRI